MSDAVQSNANRLTNPYWSEQIIAAQFNQAAPSRHAVLVTTADRFAPGLTEDFCAEAKEFYSEAISKQLYQEATVALSHWHDARAFIHFANAWNYAPSFASHIIGNELDEQFRFYSDRWYQSIKFVSSTTRMTTDPNYFKIIGMGKKVVPLILHELEHTPAPWFVALRVLTGNTEVGREFRGDFEKIAESWVAWGRSNAII
jgi:hypothetical protein